MGTNQGLFYIATDANVAGKKKGFGIFPNKKKKKNRQIVSRRDFSFPLTCGKEREKFLEKRDRWQHYSNMCF